MKAASGGCRCSLFGYLCPVLFSYLYADYFESSISSLRNWIGVMCNVYSQWNQEVRGFGGLTRDFAFVFEEIFCRWLRGLGLWWAEVCG
jgi:hypothetical protein